MRWEPPREILLRIGTVEDPAIFHGGHDLLLCYEIAPVDGGGNAILAFTDVSFFQVNGWANVPEGFGTCNYPVRAWDFTEVFGSDRTERSTYMRRRFWTISFNDALVEIVFSEVRQAHAAPGSASPREALLDYLRMSHQTVNVAQEGSCLGGA